MKHALIATLLLANPAIAEIHEIGMYNGSQYALMICKRSLGSTGSLA